MKTRLIISILLVNLLTGCTAAPERSPINEKPSLSFESDLFGESPEIIAVEDIYRLSETQQQTFLAYFDDPKRRGIPAHERVYNYLETVTAGFSYRGETYTANVALQESAGDCLSLAILTTALANLVGVDTGYQLVDSSPVFESHGSVIFKALHVRTILYDPDWQPQEAFNFVGRPGFQIDYFPNDTERFIGNLDEVEYIAMYYSNLAGAAVAAHDYQSAYWLLQRSMDLAPDNAGVINTMAVIYLRAGDAVKAEEIYRYGIENLSDKVSLLRNYRILLNKQNRLEEAAEITATLAKLDDPSPFDWLNAGEEAYNDGDYKDAISFYKKAVKIAPYLHESYSGLAKTYYQMGKLDAAERELKNALEYSYRESIRSRYQAKLMALNNKF